MNETKMLLELPRRRWIPTSSLLSVGIGVVLTLAVVVIALPFETTAVGAFILGRGLTQPITLAIAFTVAHYCIRRCFVARNEQRHVDRDWIPRGMINIQPSDVDIDILLGLFQQRQTLIGNRLTRLLMCFRDSRSRENTRELHQDDVALTQADIESGFLVTRTMIWALPMLGFLGTVLGISVSIGGFSGLLANVEDLDKVKSSLTQVTGGLSTAFDTTLLGIIAAIICMLLMSITEKAEQRLACDIEATINDELFPRLGNYETSAT